MKNISKMFVFVLVFAFLIPRATAVSAGDYVTDTIEALKTSSVYIHPSTENTDYNTEVKLKQFLGATDNIVLIMLPTEALAGTDIYSLVQNISAGLDNSKTIGLAVGRTVIGYSKLLPEGVASERMERADSLSNDPITALISFAQNVHAWQQDNPQYKPSPTPAPTATPRPTPTPIELPKTNEVPPIVWVLVIGGFFTVVIVGAVQIKKGRDKRKYNSLISKTR